MATNEKNGPTRQALKTWTDGEWGRMGKAVLNTDKPTPHKLWQSAQRGGKKAFTGMETIGGQLWNGETDPVGFVKKFDPQNTSGAVPESLDMMEKMLAVTKNDALQSSIDPLGSILGGSLYGKLSSFLNGSSASSKGQGSNRKTNSSSSNNNVVNILAIIIQLVKDVIAFLDDRNAKLVADRLNETEYLLIQTAYLRGTRYSSNRMPQQFVNEINRRIPVIRKAKGLV